MNPIQNGSPRRIFIGFLIASSVVSALGLLRAQSAATRPQEFDAVSIKPHAFGDGRGASDATTITRDAQVLRLQTVGILRIITFAYDITGNEVQGLPSWSFEPVYDCVATSASPVSLSEQKKMLQHVLADRFGLVVHRTTKEGKTYVLGLIPQRAYQLMPSSGAESQDIGHFRNHPIVHSDGTTFNIDYVGAGVTMADFTAWLSQTLGSPVEDRTGIEGHFDMTIHGPAIEMETGSQEDKAQFTTIVRAQFGLNLESGRGSVETLVVDRIQKPSEN